MRKGLLLALALMPSGCAHQRATNLAQRPAVETPRGDLDRNTGHKNQHAPAPIEPVPKAPVP
jgi:PBP1b-binding outer membrane lipoprotein LpoB